MTERQKDKQAEKIVLGEGWKDGVMDRLKTKRQKFIKQC